MMILELGYIRPVGTQKPGVAHYREAGKSQPLCGRRVEAHAWRGETQEDAFRAANLKLCATCLKRAKGQEETRQPGRRGWFADIDNDQIAKGGAVAQYPWQPCLQADGTCHSFEIWFKTQEECEQWIRDNVLGKDMI